MIRKVQQGGESMASGAKEELSMRTANQPTPNQPGLPPRRVSGVVLILSLALAVSTTAAVVLGVLFVMKPMPNGDAPYEQHGTVSPRGKFSDSVIYAVPYRLPPSLKLTSAKRPFDITKQDEKGFTWIAKAMPEDIKDDRGFGAEMLVRRYELWYLEGNGYLGQTVPSIEDFTWEANGLRAVEDPKPAPR
jgi:hypothetical protein